MLGLGLLLSLEVLVNWVGLQNYPVGLVLNLHLHFLCNRRVVGNVQVSIVLSLLCSVLPNVRSKYSSCSSIDNMSSGMESSKSISTLNVNLSWGSLANGSLVNCMIKIMEEALAYFLNIIDLVMAISKEESSQIMNLSSWGWIECTPV